ncbi:ATP-grasp domain-containing protein [Vibrio mexicanus]|uniref:ATP-grasp domain-containing protein n=1 Tax=Vibrio mexicanus TaxID=1004326 RepID=UPI00063C51C3|nr:ATP-grasp domain-containing protein [Vibrio mexicanus]
MNKKYNVLVFPAGEINASEIHTALSSQVNIEIFGASSVSRNGPYIFKNYRTGLPFISDDEFISCFNDLIDEWNIDIVIPTHDSVVEFFSNNQDAFNCLTLSPNEHTANICRDKLDTYLLFEDESFCPKFFQSLEVLNSSRCNELFLKPRRGQGSKGAKFITKVQALSENIDFSEYVICEYLEGEELTIDCFTNYADQLLGVFPRTRARILGGVSVSGKTLEADKEIMSIADTINRKLKFNGMWYFQVRKDFNGKWKLLEISARAAGAQCITRARGVNLPLLSIYNAFKIDVNVIGNDSVIHVERSFVNKYQTDIKYDTVFIDFDDTITKDRRVNPSIISLVYQFKNNNKKVHLITRHEGSIEDTLKDLCIDFRLFDSIIHLKNREKKSDYITTDRTIFIDNAFVERKEVKESLGIPVFDVDTTEVLLEWRS